MPHHSTSRKSVDIIFFCFISTVLNQPKSVPLDKQRHKTNYQTFSVLLFSFLPTLSLLRVPTEEDIIYIMLMPQRILASKNFLRLILE